MSQGRLRLRYRILIPFALVALAATAATAYVTLRVAVRAVESRVQGQIINAAALIGQGDFAQNAIVLRSVKAIAGSEVITFDPAGSVLASTLDRPDTTLVRSVIAGVPAALSSPSNDEVVLGQAACDEGPCYVAYRRVRADPRAVVAVVAATSELKAATRTVSRAIAIAAVLSLTAMIAVSQYIARRISTPLDDLVRFTNDIVDGASHRRAPVGDDEVGRLGLAFNGMLERLERSQKALVQSEKLGLAGLIAARVAHDIRNPLSSMKMQAQLLLARLKGDTEQKVLANVLYDIGTVEAVIRDLLELARPGAVSLKPERLNDIVGEVIEQVSPQLAYRKIGVQTHFSDTLPPMMLDAERFKQALLNVVLNAADAMSAGGTLEVHTAVADSTAVIDVCDDGSGVDPAVLDRVFDPFVSTKRDGVGLGLVNTKAVVESHGGRVALKPRTPRGTVATIWLPIRDTNHG
jgi:signal transduction histidine kinase